MALRKSRMRRVALKEALNGEYTEAFQCILAGIYPLQSASEAQLYGERMQDMRWMLVPNGVPLAEAMGVCVDVPPEAEPDYRMVGKPEVWLTHTRARLSFIPMADRRHPL